MDEPVPQIRIALALLVGLTTLGYGAYTYVTQASTSDTAQPALVMGAGAVIFLSGVIRWGYRNRKL